MRKVELSLREKEKYEVIKKLVESNGNEKLAQVKLGFKDIRQINRLINGYKEYGKKSFVRGNRGRKPVHTLSSVDGVMDIHFLNSTRHSDGKVDTNHQKCIKIAAGIG